VVWQIQGLAPGASREVCAILIVAEPGNLALTASARGACAKPVETTCNTRVVGLAAILLEVVDLEDPIEVGANEVYEISVTNQGTAADTNIRVVCTLEDAQQFVSGTGATAVKASGGTITMDPLPSLAPKAKATWRVTAKALKEGDVRFGVKLNSDVIGRPVDETEATRQY
jgi:hypothetical protein